MFQKIKSKIKQILIATGIIGITLAAGTQFLPEKEFVEYDYPQGKLLKAWVKPTTDKGWIEDVIEESLNVKFSYQLDQMEENLTEKLPKVQKDLDKFIQCPECIKWELTERFKQLEYNKKGLSEGKTLQQWVDEDFQSQLSYYQWKTGKIKQSLKRIAKEKELRATKKVDRTKEIKGTTLYVDSSDCTNVLAGTWTFTSASSSVNSTDGDAVNQVVAGSHIKSSAGDTTQWYTVSTRTANQIVLTATYLGTTATDTASTTCRNVNTGLATTTAVATGSTSTGPYSVLDQFTEVARSAGDKVIIRRGNTAKIDDRTDTNFTSDGTIVSPLVIEADYDGIWGSFATSTGTSTLTFGSTTVTMSTTTGIAVGNWIYNPADNNRDYAYEVSSTTATTLILYLPFKGTAGTGITLTIMPANPQWNIAAEDFQWNFDTDNYWKVQGIDIRGTNANGQVEIDSSLGHQFIDCIFTGDDVTVYAIFFADDSYILNLYKSRTQDESGGIYFLMDTYGKLSIYNSIIQCDGDNYNISIGNPVAVELSIFDSQIGDSDSYSAIYAGTSNLNQVKLVSRNSTYTGSNNKYQFPPNSLVSNFYFEDYLNVIGNNIQTLGLTTVAKNTPQVLSTSTTVHSGGGATSLELRPTTNMNTNWDFGRVQLFEYPIYADTTSKTYSMYFRSSATGDWTNDPLATELWIECEYWGHASNNYRRLTKSTGVLDFNGTTTWNALSVTCQPSQEGILYLRGFYAKTKEAGTNIFFMDVQPTIE